MGTQYFLKKNISASLVIFFFCAQALQLSYADERASSESLRTLIKECCDDLADDIFATQTILSHKIDEQTALITKDFEFTWSKIDEQTATILDAIKVTNSLIASTCGEGGGCCDKIINKIDEQTAILQADFEFTWSKIDVQSSEIHNQFLITWSLIESIQTGSVCCNQILDKIDEQTAIITKDFEFTWSKIDVQSAEIHNQFLITWSLIESIQTGSVCCNQILDKIDEQTAIITKDFEFTWSKIDVQSAEIHQQFLITWSLIESIQTGSVCCNQILDKIDEQTAILTADFEFTWSKIDVQSVEIHQQFLITWSLIESIQTGSVCCNQILDKIDEQTAILTADFEFTWSKIDVQSAEIHDQFLITWSLIESIQTGSVCCNQILDKIDEQTAILTADFEFTWSKIDVQSAEIHDQFLITWSLIESIQTGSVCCDQILERIDELEAFIASQFNLLFEILSRLFCKVTCCPTR